MDRIGNNSNELLEALQRDMDDFRASGSAYPCCSNVFDKEDIEFYKASEKFDQIRDNLAKGIRPDSYELDSLFVSFFLNEDMYTDFSWILQEFYRHEADRIESFSKINYVKKEYREPNANVKICNDGLNLIFNAFRDGNEYARHTLQNLYKTYYKTEYRSFKRFDLLTLDGLFNLAGKGIEDDENLDCLKAARVITACDFFDKPMDESVYFFFPWISDWGKGFSDFLNEKARKPEIADEAFQETKDRFLELLEYIRSKEGASFFESARKFARDCMAKKEYYEAEESELFDIPIYFTSMANTLALLQSKKSLEKYNLKELILLGVMAFRISELCDDLAERDMFTENMLQGIQTDYLRYRFPKENDAKKPDAHPRVIIKNDSKQDRDALLLEYSNEIDRLRRELHLSRQETSHYRQLLEKNKEELSAEKAISETLRKDREELYSLRDYVYGLSEEDLKEEKESTEELCEQLSEKRVVVIGGHPNWTYKFRNMFPKWRFISPTASGSIDAKVMDKTDCALFFTDIISHSVYNKYVALAREKKVPFGYLHATNVDASVREMARAVLDI